MPYLGWYALSHYIVILKGVSPLLYLHIVREPIDVGYSSSILAVSLPAWPFKPCTSNLLALSTNQLASGKGSLQVFRELLDLAIFTPTFNGPFNQLSAIVRYYHHWETKPAYDILPHKFLDFFSGDSGQWLGFHPLSEIVYGDYYVLELSRTLGEGTQDVQASLVEGLW
ncbi:hypothetical protein Tco_1336084 [Tanacetum coccineum]